MTTVVGAPQPQARDVPAPVQAATWIRCAPQLACSRSMDVTVVDLGHG